MRRAFYSVFYDLVTQSACREVSHLFNSAKSSPALVENVLGQSRISSELRRGQVVFGSSSSKHFQDFQEMAHAANAAHWNYQVERTGRPQICRYGVGDFFNWHADGPNPAYAVPKGGELIRKVTWILFLSDTHEYEGGNLEICDPNGIVYRDPRFRKLGTAVAFPSYLQHRVTPISSGSRETLTLWLEGPSFR